MKLSIFLLATTTEVLTLGFEAHGLGESMEQAVYARHEILPRGIGRPSGGSPGPHQRQSFQPDSNMQAGSGASSPPDTPRSAGMRADAAEASARKARNDFKETGKLHLQRMNDFAAQPAHRNPDIAHRERMRMLNDYRAVPLAKEDQTVANTQAADAARRAGRFDRQDRWNRKAAATAVQSQYHHANLDAQEHASTGLHQYEKYQRGSHLLGLDAPWVHEAKTNALKADGNERNARRKMAGLLTEARRLRKHEGGRDTDSDSSDASG